MAKAMMVFEDMEDGSFTLEVRSDPPLSENTSEWTVAQMAAFSTAKAFEERMNAEEDDQPEQPEEAAPKSEHKCCGGKCKRKE